MRKSAWFFSYSYRPEQPLSLPVIVTHPDLSPREKYGVERLRTALRGISRGRVVVRIEPRLSKPESFHLSRSWSRFGLLEGNGPIRGPLRVAWNWRAGSKESGGLPMELKRHRRPGLQAPRYESVLDESGAARATTGL